ncbi:hypothetical protein EI77_01846 [Prosthecobacter fusiformis]|uniref:Uncharacterized protein n=1 Tax=Prosthecobacter fusiformis TaxID=48464 RepID=A0A4R7S6P5_9BACT|nr:hypothetical protein [Prosthecobacter fusiformis]TDU73376.1 hypothetical protein EI77_01846 [Prosthecobacter fusiformis]
MKTTSAPDSQRDLLDTLKQQFLGIQAQTAPYPAARSLSGGRRRVVGKCLFEDGKFHLTRLLPDSQAGA